MKWDEFFIKMTDFIAQKSKDRATKIGVVIVGPHNEVRSIGYNGFPRGVDDDIAGRHLRPSKYLWTEHAERNAIYNAARMGTSLQGCTIYTVAPCSDCARAIIQSGIVKVVARPFPQGEGKADWTQNIAVGLTMLKEAGVEFVLYERKDDPLSRQEVSNYLC